MRCTSSFHLVDVIEQEVLYTNIENACIIAPTNDVVSYYYNLYERVFNPSLIFNCPFLLLSSTLRFSFVALCTTNFSRF